jgi:hypothetical protein
MAEAIINLQALLVKSYLLDALLINRKAFPIGCHGAQVLLFLDIGQRCTGKRSQAENVVRSRCRRPWLRERPRVYCSTIETLPAMIVSPACLSRFVDVTPISTKGTPRG